uniref:Uncharacterized protein n=1 Tax=Wuchereria bancrofti TaxID=6293 RepID=A0A1I8EJ61_WUCBA
MDNNTVMKMVDTVVAVVETVKSPISLSSTVEAMQQQQQQEESSVKSLDLQCDEEFDEILAERPSTSYNHLHQQQQHNSTDNDISISNGEAIDNCAIVDSPCNI